MGLNARDVDELASLACVPGDVNDLASLAFNPSDVDEMASLACAAGQTLGVALAPDDVELVELAWPG